MNPGIGVHANHEDAPDLESHVPVTGGRNVRAAQKGHVDDSAHLSIAFLAIDGPNGCLPIPAVVSNVTLHLLLRLADQRVTHFDILLIDSTPVLRPG